jgi:hypothetical protein
MTTAFNRLQIFVPCALAAALLSSCATVPYQGQARDVKKKPNEGGVVAVPVDPKPEDRAKAEEHMRSNCAERPFKILDEGEVTIGQKTNAVADEYHHASTQQSASLFGIGINSGDPARKNIQSQSSTQDIKEWQISYACDKAAKSTIR